jgi:hypothetical protein
LKINRVKATAGHLAAISNPSERLKVTIFGQLHREMRGWNNLAFRRAYVGKGHGGQKRAFKVKFMGEGVNDYGGPYRAVFEGVVDELQADNAVAGRKISEKCILPLFVPCPNRSATVGPNQDKFLMSPAANSPLSQELMQFLGKLMGLAIRHALTLGVNASALQWRSLVKLPLSRAHLETIDTLIVGQLSKIEALGLQLESEAAIHATTPSGDDADGRKLLDDARYQPDAWKDLVFATYLSDGSRVSLVPRGEEIPVTRGNWREYVALVERARVLESASMYRVFLDGLSAVLPTELFPLFTAHELEQLVGGSSRVDIKLLQQCTEYEDNLTPETPVVKYLWEVLEEMSSEERSLFLRFVWARSRMPASLSELSMNFKIQSSSRGTDDAGCSPDSYLPTAQTCFFSLALPSYSSKEVLRTKLLYAIENSPNMDADVRLHSAEGWSDA